jgi:hypothetical protein
MSNGAKSAPVKFVRCSEVGEILSTLSRPLQNMWKLKKLFEYLRFTKKKKLPALNLWQCGEFKY